MDFIKNIFTNGKEIEESQGIWGTLNSESQLDEIIQRSHEVPVAIFKHSTRCSISYVAKNRLERTWDIPGDKAELYCLDLIANRPVSNMVADVLAVEHESPQIILVKNGRAVYNTSHGGISTQGVKEFL